MKLKFYMYFFFSLIDNIVQLSYQLDSAKNKLTKLIHLRSQEDIILFEKAILKIVENESMDLSSFLVDSSAPQDPILKLTSEERKAYKLEKNSELQVTRNFISRIGAKFHLDPSGTLIIQVNITNFHDKGTHMRHIANTITKFSYAKYLRIKNLKRKK